MDITLLDQTLGMLLPNSDMVSICIKSVTYLMLIPRYASEIKVACPLPTKAAKVNNQHSASCSLITTHGWRIANAGESVISMAAEEVVDGIEHMAATGNNSDNGTKEIAHAVLQQKEEEVSVEVEPKKQLINVGLIKKSMLGMGIQAYGFGMYVDSSKL